MNDRPEKLKKIAIEALSQNPDLDDNALQSACQRLLVEKFCKANPDKKVEDYMETAAKLIQLVLRQDDTVLECARREYRQRTMGTVDIGDDDSTVVE